MSKTKNKRFFDTLDLIDPNSKTTISFSGGKDSCVLEFLVHEVERALNS